MTPWLQLVSPRKGSACLALCLSLFACGVAAEDDLLPPDQAFKFSARRVDAGSIEVRWRIADGYYMYRDKFRFSAQPGTVALGKPDFPAGKIKEDEFFGKVENVPRRVGHPGSGTRRRVPVQRQRIARLTRRDFTGELEAAESAATRGSDPDSERRRPGVSSMRRSWLYLATRSVRLALPVLICPTPVATARSAMKVSSVSPERWEITAL